MIVQRNPPKKINTCKQSNWTLDDRITYWYIKMYGGCMCIGRAALAIIFPFTSMITSI